MDPIEQSHRPRSTPIPDTVLDDASPGAFPAMGAPPPWLPPTAPPADEALGHHRPVLLAIGLVLVTLGLFGATFGIVDVVRAVSIPQGEIATRGQTGRPMTYERRDGDPARWTVYLVSSSSSSDDTDQETSSTACDITYADGTSGHIDGARQVNSVDLDGTASIGYFDAPVGLVSVVCRSTLGTFPVLVAQGGPRLGVASIGLLLGGLAALAAGIVVTIFGGRRRPARTIAPLT